jgi:hypothetical protein
LGKETTTLLIKNIGEKMKTQKKDVGNLFMVKLPEQMGVAVANAVSFGYLLKKNKR